MTRVDSHMHVWRAAAGETAGIATIVPPQTDVPIDAARQVMAEHDIERAVLVQPVFRGEDNSYVAQCARSEPQRFAAVCVVDPRWPASETRLAHWVSEGCRGLRLRPRLAEEAAVFGAPSTFPLWEMAQRLGVVVSLLCSPPHLGSVAALAERFGGVPMVIDHLGHPDPARGPGDADFAALLALARFPRVLIKVSGCYHFSHQPYPFADCWPLVRAVYEHFGPRRMLWGSDYPHVTQTCGYEASLRLPLEAVDTLTADELAAISGDNARALYWPDA